MRAFQIRLTEVIIHFETLLFVIVSKSRRNHRLTMSNNLDKLLKTCQANKTLALLEIAHGVCLYSINHIETSKPGLTNVGVTILDDSQSLQLARR